MFFGKLFDLDGDGSLDFFERTLELGLLSSLMEDEERQDLLLDDYDPED